MSETIQTHWFVARASNSHTSISALKKYDSLAEARKEAEKLAAKEETVFFVYQTVGVARPLKPPVEWVDLD